mgnify:FL=1
MEIILMGRKIEKNISWSSHIYMQMECDICRKIQYSPTDLAKATFTFSEFKHTVGGGV